MPPRFGAASPDAKVHKIEKRRAGASVHWAGTVGYDRLTYPPYGEHVRPDVTGKAVR